MHIGLIPLPPIPSGTPAEEAVTRTEETLAEETAIHDSLAEDFGEAPKETVVVHEPTADPAHGTLAGETVLHVGEAMPVDDAALYEPLLHSAGDETATHEHPHDESLVIFVSWFPAQTQQAVMRIGCTSADMHSSTQVGR